MGRKALKVAIVRKDPAAELKGMGVEDAQLAGGGTPQVSDHGLRGHNAADPLEQSVIDGALGAFDDVGAAPLIVRHPPTIGVDGALVQKSVLGANETAVDLTGDDRPKGKESAHG
jgi:hypothetical protein